MKGRSNRAREGFARYEISYLMRLERAAASDAHRVDTGLSEVTCVGQAQTKWRCCEVVQRSVSVDPTTEVAGSALVAGQPGSAHGWAGRVDSRPARCRCRP